MAEVAQPEQNGTKRFEGNTNFKSRAFAFTINNYGPDDIGTLEQAFLEFKGTTYVLGREVGEKKEIPHIQGCVRFANPRSFNALKKEMPRAHIEKCRSWTSSVKYCMKEGDFVTNIPESEWPVENKRKKTVYETQEEIKKNCIAAMIEKIEEIVKAMQESYREIPKESQWLRYL